MTKSANSINAQGGHISNDYVGPKSGMTSKNDESKFDPLVLSGDSSHAVTEGGLILTLMPPSTTQPKNT